jgi:branched-chain amino acid transport system substrate-binding protein
MQGRRRLVVWVSLLVLALAVTPVFVGGRRAEAAGPKILKIGTIMPLSGPLGVIGLTWDRGFDLCADTLNEQGGLKIGSEKYLIQFIHEDGKASPEACAAAANKLVYQDKVKFVIGEVMTPASQAIYGVTKPAGVLHVLAYTQSPYREEVWGVGPDNPLLVLLMPTTNLAYKPFYDYLAKTYPKVKRVVHAESTYPFNKIIQEAENTAKASGLQVVGVERYDYAWTDFYPFMTAILKHQPDAISVEHAGPDQMALMVKAARELGFKGPILSLGSASPVFVLAGAGAVNCYDIMCDQAYAGDPSAPEPMRKAKQRWEAKYPKEQFADDALMAWDEVWVLAQAIEKAQSLDPAVVLKTLESMSAPGSLKTTFGPGHMGGLKTLGVNRELVRPIPISVIQGKEIKMVEWVTPVLP